MEVKQQHSKEEREKLERFKKFLKSERVENFIKSWKTRFKRLKSAGIKTLLFYLWLLDEKEESVSAKADEVLKKLMGMPEFFSAFTKILTDEE